MKWLRQKLFPGHGGKTAFAKVIGIVLTSYVRYEINSEPADKILARIVAATRVNPRWLRWGIGAAFDPGAEVGNAGAAELIAELYEKAKAREGSRVAEGGSVYLPILARASAASVRRIGYTDHGELGRDRLPSDLHEVQVVGDSMIPLAMDGQYVLVTNADPQTGEIAIVELKDTDELLFKRVQIEPPNLVCVSVNPDPRFPVLTFPLRRLRRMRKIWGIKF